MDEIQEFAGVVEMLKLKDQTKLKKCGVLKLYNVKDAYFFYDDQVVIGSGAQKWANVKGTAKGPYLETLEISGPLPVQSGTSQSASPSQGAQRAQGVAPALKPEFRDPDQIMRTSAIECATELYKLGNASNVYGVKDVWELAIQVYHFIKEGNVPEDYPDAQFPEK